MIAEGKSSDLAAQGHHRYYVLLHLNAALGMIN